MHCPGGGIVHGGHADRQHSGLCELSSLSRVTTTGDDPGVGGAAREGVSDRVEEAAAPEMVLEEQRDASVHSSQAKIEIVSYSM